MQSGTSNGYQDIDIRNLSGEYTLVIKASNQKESTVDERVFWVVDRTNVHSTLTYGIFISHACDWEKI